MLTFFVFKPILLIICYILNLEKYYIRKYLISYHNISFINKRAYKIVNRLIHFYFVLLAIKYQKSWVNLYHSCVTQHKIVK